MECCEAMAINRSWVSLKEPRLALHRAVRTAQQITTSSCGRGWSETWSLHGSQRVQDSNGRHHRHHNTPNRCIYVCLYVRMYIHDYTCVHIPIQKTSSIPGTIETCSKDSVHVQWLVHRSCHDVLQQSTTKSAWFPLLRIHQMSSAWFLPISKCLGMVGPRPSPQRNIQQWAGLLSCKISNEIPKRFRNHCTGG